MVLAKPWTLKGPGEGASPSFRLLPAMLGILWLREVLLQSRLLPSHGLLSCVSLCVHLCLCVFPLLRRTPVIGFRSHSNPVWPHLNLCLHFICKDPTSNKATKWGSGWTGIWGLGERYSVQGPRLVGRSLRARFMRSPVQNTAPKERIVNEEPTCPLLIHSGHNSTDAAHSDWPEKPVKTNRRFQGL